MRRKLKSKERKTNPFFIAIDGVDGTGKSTQVLRLTELFRAQGIATEATFEPGATPVGAKIRELLMGRATDINPEAELLLFCADRSEHQRKVQALLAEGITVISDRFMPSTWAYQICGRGLNPTLFRQISTLTIKRLPDLTIILDMDENQSLERARQRLAATGNIDTEGRFEAESMEFFRKVRKGFLEYADMHDYGDIALLTATGDEDEVTERIKALLLEKFGVSL